MHSLRPLIIPRLHFLRVGLVPIGSLSSLLLPFVMSLPIIGYSVSINPPKHLLVSRISLRNTAHHLIKGQMKSSRSIASRNKEHLLSLFRARFA